MKLLVTAGSTQVPIDKVRSLGNIFTGKTGWAIAKYFNSNGVDVTILASNNQWSKDQVIPSNFNVVLFKTFDDLHNVLEVEISNQNYDVIVHSAAVSDYKVSSVLTRCNGELLSVDSSTKISSSYEHLYLELSPTIKLVDQMRQPWGFKGKLVKFKLQVGISDEKLIEIAKKSRITSEANYIVANCLEWSKERAYIIGDKGLCQNVTRDQLPAELYRLCND